MKKEIAAFLAMTILAISLSTPASADSISLTIGTPPPAPIVEAIPVAPGPEADYAWRAGYWRWVDERHIWVPGHWAHRPHPGAEWVAPKWEQHPEGYRFQEGHWNEHH